MEITKKIKIFPDPEFCGGPIDGEHKDCQFLVLNEDCCLFLDEKEEFTELDWKVNSLGENISTKCDLCKEEHQKQLKLNSK